MKKACSVIMCLILVLTMQFAVFAENGKISVRVFDVASERRRLQMVFAPSAVRV